MFEKDSKGSMRIALLAACALVLAAALSTLVAVEGAWADDELDAANLTAEASSNEGDEDALSAEAATDDQSVDGELGEMGVPEGALPDIETVDALSDVVDGEQPSDEEPAGFADGAVVDGDDESKLIEESQTTENLLEPPANAADDTQKPEKAMDEPSAVDSPTIAQPALQKSGGVLATQETQEDEAVGDGAYAIKPVSTYGQALGNKSAYATNAAIKSYAIDGAYDQIFFFQRAANGLYAIFSAHSGLALTASSGKLVQSTYGGSDSQLFEVRSVGDYFALIAKAGAITASAGSEAKIQSYTGSAAQKFRLVGAPLVVPGVQTLRSSADVGKAVRVKDGSSSASAGIQVAAYSSNGSYNLLVQRTSAGYAVRPVTSGCYTAASGSSVKQTASESSWSVGFSTGGSRRGLMLMSAAGKTAAQVSGSSVIVSSYAPSAAQSFLPTKTALVSSGYYNVIAANGKYLDVSEGSFSNGANIKVFNNNGSGAQVFYLEDIGGGVYVIRSSKSYKVLEAKGGGTSESTNVWQYSENLTPAQLWVPVIDKGGRMAFVNVKSGKALTVASDNVRINSSTGSSDQHWTLAATSQYSLTGSTALDKALANILSTHTTLRSAFNYVAYEYSYRSGNKHWSGWSLSDSTSREYALDMYRHGSGNCYRFASLFAWCARGLGYTDVVVRTGWVVGYSGGQAPHGWVTINGYICDPDMQHEASGRNWYWQTWASAPTAYYNW